MAILCSQCGQTLPRDDVRFCNHCGAFVPSQPSDSPEWGVAEGASMSSASQPEDRRSTGKQMQNEPPAWISNLSKNERADVPGQQESAGASENVAGVKETRSGEHVSDAMPDRQSRGSNNPPVPAQSSKNARADNMHASASTWPDPVTHVSRSDSAPSVHDEGNAVQQDFPSVLPATPRPKTPPTLRVKVWNEDDEDAEAAGNDVPASSDHVDEPVSRAGAAAEPVQSEIEDMPTSVLSLGSEERDAINAALTHSGRAEREQTASSDRSSGRKYNAYEDEHDAAIEHLDTVSLSAQKSADAPPEITERPEFNVIRENTPAPGGEATQIIADKPGRSSSVPASSAGRRPSQPGWPPSPPVPAPRPTSSPGQVASNWSSSAGPTSSPGQVASNWSSSAGPTSSPGQVASNWSPSAGPTSSPGQVASNWSSLPPVPEPDWSAKVGSNSLPGQIAASWPASPPTPPAAPFSSAGRPASFSGIGAGPGQEERNYAASTQMGSAAAYAPNTPVSSAAAPVSAPSGSRRKSRIPLIVTLIVVVLLLIGAAGGWVVLAHPFAVNPVTEPTQSFHNSDIGISLVYPTKWSAHVDSSKAHVHFSDSTNTDQFDITAAHANSTDPAQYLQDQVKQLGITAAKDGAPVSFAGTAWQQIKGNLQVNGANYTEAIYAAIHSGHLYTITNIAPQSTFADENTLVFTPTNTSLQFN